MSSEKPKKVASGEGPRLVVMAGADSVGISFPIEEGSNLVGRWDPDNVAFPEIDLEQADPEAKVSRKHAVIERNGSKVTIQDIGSLNGTFVNRAQRLEQGVVYELKPGDELMIGKTFLKYEI